MTLSPSVLVSAGAGSARPRRAMSATSAPAPHPSESFLNGTNSLYVEEMYELWKRDPTAVHASWASYFGNVDAGAEPGAAFLAPPDIQPGVKAAVRAPAVAASSATSTGVSARLMHLCRAYQVRGHNLASLDPLKLYVSEDVPELDYRTYGFTEADLDRELPLAGFGGIEGFLGQSETATLRQLIDKFKSAYCSTIGWEFMHIQSREVSNWLRRRIETPRPVYTKDEKFQILERAAFADHFERFLANKWSAAKRFGLDGAESLIPGMKALIDKSVQLGVEDVVVGMPHRGRLNVLSNVIRKPNEIIFREFQGVVAELSEHDSDEDPDWSSSGDVKYHLGTSFDRTYPDGKSIHLSLMANPSHLEAVNPVVVGKVRCKQDKKGEEPKGSKSMGLLLHGDAAFAGQGIVYETMIMAALENYTTGGTVHVVCNNQIGFTTLPHESRSSQYCSDVGKAFEIPIFHVNADDPEAVHRVFCVAAEYRATYRKDVIIDLVGYRRFGHNELDQPMFTQPQMYTRIKTHPPAVEIYKKQLVDEGSFTMEEVEAVSAKVYKTFEAAYESSQEYEKKEEWLDSNWQGFHHPAQLSRIRETGVDLDLLNSVGKQLTALPEGFSPHPNLKRQLEAKAKTIEEGEGIDWGTAEALAFGSLLMEGNTVRLSGQDVQRGTFSHRHSVLHDQHSFEQFCPLAALANPPKARLHICNSPLSEYSVLGFELGYSQEDPNQVVIWEAQFGDFANTAQVIFDQFLSAGESKWLRQSGLVVLLPHGYDGQGPEHSSCRIERFLQMCDEDEDDVPPMEVEARRQIQITNWQIVNPSTPANYFHALRRQVHRSFRKPLIIPSPKALLRYKPATSSMAEMGPGTMFQRGFPDDGTIVTDASKVRRVLMCTGKVYYDLIKGREERGLDDVAIVRVEQISPFPFDFVAEQSALYPDAELVWVQEEPQNMGCWTYVRPRIWSAVRHFNDTKKRVGYAGRNASASPATGHNKVHQAEQAQLVADALVGSWDNSAVHSPVLYESPEQSKHLRWVLPAKQPEPK